MWLRRYWVPIPLWLLLLGVLMGSSALIGLAVFILLAGFVGRRWSEHAFDRFRYERRIPENRAFAGDRMHVDIRLINDKFLPITMLEVHDHIPDALELDDEHISPSGSPGQVLLNRSTHLGWYERLTWPLEFDAPPRGYYRFGPVRLGASDAFGFFPVEREDDNRDSIIIYPRTFTMPELGLPAERPFGERKGRERIFEDPGRIAGLRDYRPGDPMRRIDWKASARSQQLQSRVYEPSSTLHLLVSVNVHTLPHGWQGFIPETLESILSVAASVARHGFETGYAVGLAANGAYPTSDRPMRIPVGRRPEQLMRILEALAVIGPLTLVPLHTVLEREAQAFPFGATLVCVTAIMDPELAATLDRIGSAGHSVVVLSLADRPWDICPQRATVHEVGALVRSLEARAIEQEAASP